MSIESRSRLSQLIPAIVLSSLAGLLLAACDGGKAPQEAKLEAVAEMAVNLGQPPLDDAERTQVLVLATPHLRSLKDKFDPALLESLLATLETFNPEVVAVENLHPLVIRAMLDRPEEFAPVLEQFAGDAVQWAEVAQKRLGASAHEAFVAANELLSELDDPAAMEDAGAKRAQLVLNFLASYDFSSALLQWSYLPETLRADTELFPEDMATTLNEELITSNEDTSVGIMLASRLGLQRVDAIDDHADKDLFLRIAGQLMEELQDNDAYKSVATAPIFAESEQRLEQAVADGDLLPYYLYVNSPAFASADVDAQFHLFFRTQLPSGLDRARSAAWEIRNLNIASHIRRVTAMHPGKRALVIIGAGHKPFLDTYLGTMMDVKVVQLSDFVDAD